MSKGSSMFQAVLGHPEPPPYTGCFALPLEQDYSCSFVWPEGVGPYGAHLSLLFMQGTEKRSRGHQRCGLCPN